MKKFGQLFQQVEAKKPVEASIEPVKAPGTPATVTMTKKQRMDVLQPATPRVVLKMLQARKGKPPLACRDCAIGSRCTKYDIAEVCAFEPSFRAYDTRNKEDIVAMIHDTVEDTNVRYHRGLLAEQMLNGGAPLPEVTRLAKDKLEQLNMLLALDNEEATLSISGEGADFLSTLRDSFMAPSEPASLEVNPPAKLPNPVRDPVVVEDSDGSRIVVEPNV